MNQYFNLALMYSIKAQIAIEDNNFLDRDDYNYLADFYWKKYCESL